MRYTTSVVGRTRRNLLFGFMVAKNYDSVLRVLKTHTVRAGQRWVWCKSGECDESSSWARRIWFWLFDKYLYRGLGKKRSTTRWKHLLLLQLLLLPLPNAYTISSESISEFENRKTYIFSGEQKRCQIENVTRLSPSFQLKYWIFSVLEMVANSLK